VWAEQSPGFRATTRLQAYLLSPAAAPKVQIDGPGTLEWASRTSLSCRGGVRSYAYKHGVPAVLLGLRGSKAPPLREGTAGEYSFSSMVRALRLTTLIAIAALPLSSQPHTPLENLRGRAILLFTPHPDDDTFCCAGTLARLAKAGNHIRIVIYTNDDKGSYDPEMTSEHLARIRMQEEEACRIIGIPKENIQGRSITTACWSAPIPATGLRR